LIKAPEPANAGHSQTNWDSAITVPAIVANQLLFPDTRWPHGLEILDNENEIRELTDAEQLLALRLGDGKNESLRIVPVIGSRWSAYREVVKMIARAAGRTVVEMKGQAANSESQDYLNSIATVCWLRGADLFLPLNSVYHSSSEQQHSAPYPMASPSIPATVFLALDDRKQLSSLPQNSLLPLVNVRPLSYEERLAEWKSALGAKGKGLKTCIAEVSRRFRYEKELIREIAGSLGNTSGKISEKALVEACRAALDVDVGDLAARVIPRFENELVILPPKQEQQFAEQIKAMQSLTEVHYVWGTAKAMNESGISVLFAGPPGTGKTMAAEVLAIKLNLPMYRIDLSQVVNKYIGETEKNLKRVFDAADISDMILFFDEADSLFGRRTEVSDAHDRYANLEISYLLERMERFKGLAILATNRKKDLDEAFLRRLRYIIDFPVPGIEQRRRIWQQVIPANADSSELDFDFLAKQFPLAGGNIRSIVFNACLQSAADRSEAETKKHRVLTMKSVLVAIRREHDKMNRSLSVGQLGNYAALLEGIEI
jgi:SpoVK/Ycf46/Vps4 family AAA+-type ATPase